MCKFKFKHVNSLSSDTDDRPYRFRRVHHRVFRSKGQRGMVVVEGRRRQTARGRRWRDERIVQPDRPRRVVVVGQHVSWLAGTQKKKVERTLSRQTERAVFGQHSAPMLGRGHVRVLVDLRARAAGYSQRARRNPLGVRLVVQEICPSTAVAFVAGPVAP